MLTLNYNAVLSDEARRRRIFNGEFFLYSAKDPVAALCTHAKQMIGAAFENRDPETAQYEFDVAEFAKVVGPLKSRFTNDAGTKQLVRGILSAFGYNLDDTYFDVPRLRVVTADNFLTSGVGYAYKAHRDTWYSSPPSQINWWLPVFDLAPERTLAFYPKYWTQRVQNSSGDFDYGEWIRVGRQMATSQVGKDTRNHPLPTEAIDAEAEMRVVLNSGEAVLFSASHLHATVPNSSGKTRFSLDFRTVNLSDLQKNDGSPNIDSQSRGTTLGDFLRASDFAPLGDVFDVRSLATASAA